MKPFDYYLNNKNVRKISKDIELAKSLKKDLFERAEKALKLDQNEFAKLIFESVYDSLREFCDVLLAIDGYKSYSHEASICYLKNYNFNDSEIFTLDRYRYKRNGSKYYGKPINKEDAEEIKKFYKEVLDKINNILDKKLDNK
tara:strand:+ start:1140 stop:1568 length:429 start_codon:yes stop_codon:yes gene_type:complete